MGEIFAQLSKAVTLYPSVRICETASLAGVAGLQRNGHLMGQYPAAGDIDQGGQVDVPPGHADIGRIQRPDLIGTADSHFAQQIGVDLVLGIALAGAWLRAQGLNAHAQHQRAQVAPPHTDALTQQHPPQHTGSHEGALQVQFVDTAHERQVGIAGRSRPVVDRASADVE